MMQGESAPSSLSFLSVLYASFAIILTLVHGSAFYVSDLTNIITPGIITTKYRACIPKIWRVWF